jgi:hypothetical protein
MIAEVKLAEGFRLSMNRSVDKPPLFDRQLHVAYSLVPYNRGPCLR